MTVPFDLDGAVAVLTGAGSGIGRATALSLAARGARIAASDVDGARAEETAALVTAAGGEAIGLRVDVAVNNVGVLAMGAPESLPVEAWQRVIDLNLLSIASSNVVFLPLLLEQGQGHVINTA